MPNKKEDILILFAANESKIEKLYKMYMLKFPSHEKLWRRLIAAKRYQIEILKDLSLRFDRYDFFQMNGYSSQILEYISNFIDEQVSRFNLEKIYLHDALSVALRLERSLKEEKSLQLLEPKHDDVFKTFKMLSNQTNQHVNLLFKAYSKLT